MKKAISALAIASLTVSIAWSALADTRPDSSAYDAEAAVAEQIARIKQYDSGPDGLNSVIVYSQTAGFKARALAGTAPLHGRSVLVKDNIETEEWATTAGSLALAYNFTRRDAPLIANLRASGGLVMGQNNLFEGANIRLDDSPSSRKAGGGPTPHPHGIEPKSGG